MKDLLAVAGILVAGAVIVALCAAIVLAPFVVLIWLVPDSGIEIPWYGWVAIFAAVFVLPEVLRFMRRSACAACRDRKERDHE